MSQAGPPRRAGLGADVRLRALQALLAVEVDGAASQTALQTALQTLGGPDRGLCTELVYGTLRRQRSLDAWTASSCDRGLVKMEWPVLCALRLGACQLAEMDRIPAFAAVDATTEACKQAKGFPAGAVGFVNAVLRKLAGRAQAGDRPPRADLPPWIEQRIADLAAATGADPTSLVDAFCQPAPTHALVLGAGDQADATARQLQADGVLLQPLPVPGAWLANGVAALAHPQFGRQFLLQDANSAAVVQWLNPLPGWQVVDVAAGRGVKSAQMAALGAQVTAVDVSGDKLGSARHLADKIGAPLQQIVVGDATHPLPLPVGSFDAVLVDAPCSGLGTLRRRPEIRHRRRAADLLALAQMQAQMADCAVPLLKPGGVLMLATCSFAAEEGPLWLRGVLQRHPQLHVAADNPPWILPFLDADGCFRSHPAQFGADAFFAVRLRLREK